MKQGSRMRWINSGGGDEELDKVSEASVAYADEAGLSNRTKLYLNGTHVTDPDFYAPTGSGYDGQILRSNGENNDPTWQYETISKLNGDNTSHGREIYAPSAVGEKYQVLESNGEGEPVWRKPLIWKMNDDTLEGTRGQTYYAFEDMGNANQIAYSTGSGHPRWRNPHIGSVNGRSNASLDIWAPTSAGTSGQILQSSGSGAPTWVDQSSPSLYSHYITISYSTSSGYSGTFGLQLFSSNSNTYGVSDIISALGNMGAVNDDEGIPVVGRGTTYEGYTIYAHGISKSGNLNLLKLSFTYWNSGEKSLIYISQSLTDSPSVVSDSVYKIL